MLAYYVLPAAIKPDPFSYTWSTTIACAMTTHVEPTYGIESQQWLTWWREEIRGVASALVHPVLVETSAAQIANAASSQEALRRVLARTGFSQREAAEFLGCSHMQIGRIRDSLSEPRAELARRIAAADVLTRYLLATAGGDPSVLARMLTSVPIDGARESASDALRRGDMTLAMALARRVLYPRVEGMVNVPASPFSTRDATRAYLDEGE